MACLLLFMNEKDNSPESNRRDFLKNTSLATLMAMMGGVELRAQDAAKAETNPASTLTAIPPPPPVNYGVVGLGERGRDILQTLAVVPSSPVVAICDNYSHAITRAAKEAPKAAPFDDYKKLLADANVQAVVVATPTGTHRDIVLDALAAGKHVYCEAPLAGSVEDAKAIARAARDAVKVVFQAGLQERSHPQRNFLVPFIRSGAIGANVMARAQWHKKDSWARSSSNADREKALNWRLDQATSSGLLGEVGIHQIDVASWFLKNRPVAVTGFGSTILWKGDHGRTVPDTVQAVFEFPEGANFIYDATLCSSFQDQYEVYCGTASAIMVRDNKAWLFKEVDADLLGWEVYARKDVFYKETGIALIAGGSKQSALGGDAVSLNPYEHLPLYYALDAFTANAGLIGATVKNYIDLYGDGDLAPLVESYKTLKTKPAASWRDGLDATVLALKASEAAVKKERIIFDKDWFEI
jgi:predicted dehydrogenase